MLSGPEQELFARFSVFAGSWTLEAAEAVGAGDPAQAERVLDLLSMLADKSLVVAEANAGGALRYKMLEPVRQFALERLVDCGAWAGLPAIGASDIGKQVGFRKHSQRVVAPIAELHWPPQQRYG